MGRKKLLSAALIVAALAGIVEGANMKLEKAVFAGGCFWCMLPPFQKLDGVKEIIAGYTGGQKENPNYEEVSSGKTGHYEAVEITFDPSKITYAKLLDVFWRQIDPTDTGGQFSDKGTQYRTAIFYNNQQQRAAAEKSKSELENSGRFDKPIATAIIKAERFYRAEEYHQDYPSKNPSMYNFYKENSGRGNYLEEKWKKDAK